MDPKPRFITATEIAAETQIPKSTIYKMIQDGRIPGYRFVPNGNTGLRVDRNDYERWVTSCRIRRAGRPLGKRKNANQEDITPGVPD